MRGFAPYALVLLSDPAKYKDAYGGYKHEYKASLDNLFEYLRSIEMPVRCLTTDPLASALLYYNEDITWCDTEDAGGMYFMYNNCGLQRHDKTLPLDQATVDLLKKKFPVERGINAERRAFLVSKRVALAEKELIRKSKVIFCFGSLFKPAAKANDGRAVCLIDSQFVPTMLLSGERTIINEFLGLQEANLPLMKWGCIPDGGAV